MKRMIKGSSTDHEFLVHFRDNRIISVKADNIYNALSCVCFKLNEDAEQIRMIEECAK